MHEFGGKIAKGIRNWLNQPLNRGVAHSYDLLNNMPNGTYKTRGDGIEALILYELGNSMNRFSNSKVIARVNATHLSPQMPKVTVSSNVAEPTISVARSNQTVQSSTRPPNVNNCQSW